MKYVYHYSYELENMLGNISKGSGLIRSDYILDNGDIYTDVISCIYSGFTDERKNKYPKESMILSSLSFLHQVDN